MVGARAGQPDREHTDYNEGFAFPIAIDKRTTVAARVRADRLLRVTSSSFPGVIEVSLDRLDPDSLTGWAAYPLGVAKRDAGDLLRELWSLGQGPTADALLKDVTGAKLEMASVVDRIREGLGG